MLQAPPGAGKTTLVPPALLDSVWLDGRSIVMLEPRRLAARAAAFRIAELRNERVGETAGYRMRGDTRIGRDTRIEVVTEGVLTRRLQRDPTLEGVGILIFDEFHERSLDADLGLALALRTQELVRDDMRILIMSATLDGAAVARLLGNAPVLTSEGHVHPVETRYRPSADDRTEAMTVAVILEALRIDAGDVLVFLPGAGEIRRVEAALASRDLRGAMVAPLYGMLSQGEQDRAVRPDPNGRRKVVLSTSIAETSLTIEGIRVVIDSGLSRVPRFSPRTGMTRLETVRVSRASADQRRGRAGRLAPGVCYRLWAEHDDHALLASSPPEILNADLAPLALDLAAAGVRDPSELRWLDVPAPAAFAQACELLAELDALDSGGSLTAHGRKMAALPVHPRLAHMLLRARDRGELATGALLAALLGERDVFRGSDGQMEANLALRLAAVDREEAAGPPIGLQLDRDAVRRVRAEADRLLAQLEGRPSSAAHRASSHDTLGALAALAYPDRVAQRRPGDRARYVLRNGRGAELTGTQSLARSPYIVAVELDDRRPESRVFRAASLDEAEVRDLFGAQIATADSINFDDASGTVVARRREMLGAITLRDVDLPNPDPEAVRRALLDAIGSRGLTLLPWSESAQRLRARLAFVAHHDKNWPDVSEGALTQRLEEWLGPSLHGVRRVADVARIDLGEALLGLLDWQQRRLLDELAPAHIVVPTGSRIAVDYSDPDAPALAVRIQEIFGMTQSPRVMGERVPVTMHLLSPAHRPVQVTRDLAGFWRTSYFDVRRDLRGRYPKHEWPEDPLAATPTRRAKPRK